MGGLEPYIFDQVKQLLKNLNTITEADTWRVGTLQY